MPQSSEAFFKGIALSSIHEEATFFDVVQEWKFSRSTARSLARRRRVYGGLPPSLARFFLLLSFLRIIGCNYIKVETYNTRHLALPPSLPSPTDRRQAAKAVEETKKELQYQRDLIAGGICIFKTIIPKKKIKKIPRIVM